jgi:hypothetical protein
LVSALAISAAAIGAANTLREIVKEAAIYARERAGGLDPRAYLVSKMMVFGTLTALQIALLVGLAVGRAQGPTASVLSFPPLLELMCDIVLTAVAAGALGLLISALVSNSEKAMALIAVVFILQWLFSGAAVNLQSKPVVQQAAYLAASNWGVAAAGSSVDLKRLEDNACTRTAGGPSGPSGSAVGVQGAPPCDARWQHSFGTWATSILGLLILTAGELALAMAALARKDPIRPVGLLAPAWRRAVTALKNWTQV